MSDSARLIAMMFEAQAELLRQQAVQLRGAAAAHPTPSAIAAVSVSSKSSKAEKEKKDPNKPKRNKNSYNIFMRILL